MSTDHYTVVAIDTPELHAEALNIFKEVYQEEKGWVGDRAQVFPLEDLHRSCVDWLGVRAGKRLVGVVRVLYELPFELYKSYGFKLTANGLDIEKFIRDNRIAEVGRFAVLPQYRREIMAVAMLMRSAGMAAIARGFTHFITDVFEDDPNTPHGFHRRVLGFVEVATHDHGELKCASRRITMLLDLKQALTHIEGRKGWLFRFFRSGKLGKIRPAVAT